MRWLAVVLLACASPAKPRVVAAPPAVPPPAAPYPLRPVVRWLIAGDVALDLPHHTLTVPYFPGLTVRGALRIGGAARAMKASGTLTRLERDDTIDYELPITKILKYEAPDAELAPGDRLVVHCESGWGC